MRTEDIPGFPNIHLDRVQRFLTRHDWILLEDESKPPAFLLYERHGEWVRIPGSEVADYHRRMVEVIEVLSAVHGIPDWVLVKEWSKTDSPPPRYIPKTRSGFPTILIPAGQIPKGVVFRKCNGSNELLRIHDKDMRYAFEEGSRPKDGHIATIELQSGYLGAIRVDKNVELVLEGNWQNNPHLIEALFGEGELACGTCFGEHPAYDLYMVVGKDKTVECICTSCLKYEMYEEP